MPKMKKVAKNEIVLHDPYSNALCATCRRGQCKEQWLVRGAQGRAMGERAASRVLYIISGLQVFITWMQWARAHFILPMAHL